MKPSFRWGWAGLLIGLGCAWMLQASVAWGQGNTNNGVLDTSHRKRFLTCDEQAKARVLAAGGTLIKEGKHVKVFLCSPKVASDTGLSEDLRVYAVDTQANLMVGANFVQFTNGFTGKGTKVVILDTGINYNHPELRSSYLGGTNFVALNNDPMDDHGHGTHVAGIITADGLTDRVRGVAPGAGIIAGKVLNAGGSGYFSDVIEGIYWAVEGPDGIVGTADDFHPDVISMSLGTYGAVSTTTDCDTYYPEITAAIRFATEHGTVVVCAAGNNGESGVSLPGCVSYCVTVSAVDFSANWASFSSVGQPVELAAPGVSIYSTYFDSYAYMSGTSMATPVVSGIFALLRGAFPNATPNEIQAELFSTAMDFGTTGRDYYFGYGLVQVNNAFQNLSLKYPRVSLSIVGSQTIIQWPAAATGFVLECSFSIPSDQWTAVPDAPTQINGTNVVAVPVLPANLFYRLRKN